MSRVASWVTVVTLTLAGLAVGWTAPGTGAPQKAAKDDKKDQVAAEKSAFFEKEIKPILEAHCFACHGAEAKIKGELRLTSRAGFLKGGKSGPAVEIDKPEDSRLLDVISYQGSVKMPPKGKLPQAQIDLLTRWVKMGVPWAEDKITVRHGPSKVDDKAKSFWSFRPVVRPDVPKVKNAEWVKNPIDAFVLAKLEAAGLQPAPPADKTALLRRVYYDLIGLPPTPQEVETVLSDPSPDWYEKVVDRLLASPHYGEHWARHWLDLVRYAETNSFERDGAKPFIWRYRDYVIRSLNDDKPYDQFLREQLAGDELDKVTPETIIATGYYRLGLWDDEPADPLLAMYDELDDIASTTGQVFMGLTVGCARCHDHKIDPFPQKDYYQLIAFFNGIRRYGVRSAESVAAASLRPIAVEEGRTEQQEQTTRNKRKLAEVEKQIAAIEDSVRQDLAGGEIDDFQFEQNRPALIKKRVPKLVSQETFDRYLVLRKQRDELKNAKSSPQALCVTEVGPTPRETFLLIRGNPQAKGEKVEPGFPSVLTDVKPILPKADAKAQTSGRRRVLADWLASPENPLTARVMVNRIWQYHFGRGLVRSSSNFGYGGTPPTHPELLDWLASDFVTPSPQPSPPRGEGELSSPSPPGGEGRVRGWSLKAMHKQILLSNTYRMSSRGDKDALAKDPENELLWRFDMRRLTAEEVRDSILAACGSLNRKKLAGPSVYPTIPKEVLAGQSQPGLGWGKSTPEEAASRSVYVHIKRSLLVPILSAFDTAETDASCAVRFTTTQPTQALGMMNGDFLNEQAKIFADNVQREASTDPAAQVRLTLRRVLQRQPSDAEVERGVKFLRLMKEDHKLSPEESLRRFCLLALNLNEFVYLD